MTARFALYGTDALSFVLSGLLIDLIREARHELRLHDYSTDYSARKNLSIGDSVYKSME